VRPTSSSSPSRRSSTELGGAERAPGGAGDPSAPGDLPGPLARQLRAATARPVEGSVRDFDDEVGLGVVEAAEGRFAFHCTEIADGSRHVERGARVRFWVAPGRGGLFEARDLRPA
jgi:cold shock CspA family protein